jgi:hypothetical protein
MMLNNMSTAINVMNQTHTRPGLTLFRKAIAKGKKARLIAALKHEDIHLFSIEEITEGKSIHSQCYCGLRTVAINMIQGSDSRSEDFDRFFNPLKTHEMHRWMRVADIRLRGSALPAVDLIQIGELFFVMDGHHRISVAKALGKEFIEANVTHWG